MFSRSEMNTNVLSKVISFLKSKSIKISPSILDDVRHLLLREGFHHTRLQKWKQGQIFGLVKKLSFIKQLHIRAFVDGRLDAEEEIWRFLVPFHLIVRPNLETALRQLRGLLRKNLTALGTWITVVYCARMRFENLLSFGSDPHIRNCIAVFWG